MTHSPPATSRRSALAVAGSAALVALAAQPAAADPVSGLATIRQRSVAVDGVKVFYREAGAPDAPVLLLLHGFPTSSQMFRALMPALADRYRLIAPDLPGFGFTEVVDPRYVYSFDSLARTLEGFTAALRLDHYALYVFDYGAPVGLRLALAHPERVTALISQNGNAYEEGLGGSWSPIQRYWRDPSAANRAALSDFLTPAAVRAQYREGVTDPSRLLPDGYTLDSALLARPGQHDIQLDLFLDYRSNIALYPAFQSWLRTSRPPLLAVWGANDPFFVPAGAQAFRRDVPGAEVTLLDTGHFALETHAVEITAAIRRFLAAHPPA